MAGDLSIGDFSRITHLSIRTLRRYHQAKLLEPHHVDSVTGYRYYSLDQVGTAQVIHRFRELGMPVRQVAELVAIAEPEARAAMVAQHLRRLEAQLDETRAAVVALRRLLAPDPAPLEIRQCRMPSMTVAAVRDTVKLGYVVEWYDGAMRELDEAVNAAGAAPTGPPGGLYDHELFTAEVGRVTVYIPVAHPPMVGRVESLGIPSADLATVVHCGPHDDIDITYAALGSYVRQQALELAGPVREIYRVGPRDVVDPRAWRTEIGWPIFATTALDS